MFVCVSVCVCEYKYIKHLKHVLVLLKSREPNKYSCSLMNRIDYLNDSTHEKLVRPNLVSPGYSLLKFRHQGRRLFHFTKKILI